MRRDRINKFTENLLRLAALERVRQLELVTENMNVINKQLELLETINTLIMLANSSPAGQVEIVITTKV